MSSKFKKILILGSLLISGLSWARLATTSYTAPALPPVLASNPTNAIRKASSASNDQVPWLDLLGFNRVDNTTVPNAFCNDGSKPVYYHRKGAGQGANRWIIWLEGGGGCGSADPASPYWCGLRKNTPMWSSNNMLGLINAQGVFSGLKNSNPDFYSYNHVMVHYCSGDWWRGQGVKKVINTATNESWWFSGQKIVEAVLKDLELKHGFKNATNIILTGTSAGAIGITMNSNMIKDLYPTKDIVTVIDAGWSGESTRFDVNSPGGYNEMSQLDPELMFSSYAFTGLQPSAECLKDINWCPPNAKCADRRKYCVLPPVASKFLKVPYFVVHDFYDRVLGYLGFSFDVCKFTDRTKYETWLNNYNSDLQPDLLRPLGVFATRSGQHGMFTTNSFFQYSAPNGATTYKLKDVFGAWYFGRSTPKVWLESQSATLSPDQEVRSKNGCAIAFP